MAKRKKKNNSLTIGYYVVAFFDLLGQQEYLRNLRSLPEEKNPQGLEKLKEDLKNTYGVVTNMRKFFSDSFEAFSHRPTKDLSKFTAQQKREYSALTNNPIKYQTFSDSILIFMPLKTDTAKLPIRGIYGILGAAATTFICSLAAGHPIRGGIDVGIGMDITKTEIYGPALSRAYSLESKIANYPRIVVGKELVNYIHQLINQTPHDIASNASKELANLCLDYLAVDDDGYPIVDYLGEHYKQLLRGVIDSTIVKKAYDQVIKSCGIFQSSNNSKLAFRYTLLRNYFENRLHLWENQEPENIKNAKITDT
ncbi:MAG: hypothetical protein C4575_11240 [Desulforudis sp.]|jgi:hypothetical protein|nr:MAG: hypothetical protein C4575_11240 [Desulforudis sp.]